MKLIVILTCATGDCAEPGMLIEPVNQEIIVGVAKYYDPKGSRDNTTFGCAVAAKYKSEGKDVYIISWNSFYEKTASN